MTDTSSPKTPQSQLSQLRPQFRTTLADRLPKLEELRDGPAMDQDPRRCLEVLQRFAVKSGSMAEPLGFDDLTTLCQTAATQITALLADPDPQQNSFDTVLNAIDDMLGEMALVVESSG